MKTSLAKEVERQMSIVTQLSDISTQYRAFNSGRSKVHAWNGDLHKQIRGRRQDVGRNTDGCVGVCLQTNMEFGVKHLRRV